MKGVLLHNRVHNSQGDCDTSYSKQKALSTSVCREPFCVVHLKQ